MNRLRRALWHLSRGAATRQDGQVLALFAAGLVGVCGLVGLSIDVGRLAFTASDTQKIADAAALAAAQDLPDTTVATETANSYRDQNGSASLQITYTNADYTVEVAATRQVDFTFLKVIGLSGKSVTRRATVEAEKDIVTGYTVENTAPFVIWGGSRKRDVHPGDSTYCPPYGICVGKVYTFYSPNWGSANGQPSLPDWTNVENNFKGSVEHGDGAEVLQNGDIMSVGGMGSPPLPAVGDIIVIPIVDKGGGNADEYQFRIVAWVQIEVTSCSLTVCDGEILNPATTAPRSGWVGGGSFSPPPSLTYIGTKTFLIN
jgi:Flp pilus assembly protein TadG